MQSWLSRLSWPAVVVVGLALAALVGVVALLPGEARTDVILGLLTLAGALVAGVGAMPSMVRSARPTAPLTPEQRAEATRMVSDRYLRSIAPEVDDTRPVRVSSVPPRGER